MSGFTGNREIPIAKSVMDYVFRYLGNRFLADEAIAPDEQEAGAEEAGLEPAPAPAAVGVGGGREKDSGYAMVNQADAPSCMDCGSIMIRNGACYKCPNCGSTSGCS